MSWQQSRVLDAKGMSEEQVRASLTEASRQLAELSIALQAEREPHLRPRLYCPDGESGMPTTAPSQIPPK